MEKETIVNFVNTIEVIGYFVIFYFFLTKRGETEKAFARIGDEVAAKIYKFFKKEG